MGYLETYQQQLKHQISQISHSVNDNILDREKEITDLNIKQIKNHDGNDGLELINTNPRYSGFYTKFTEAITDGKKRRGAMYDFYSTGAFLNNFHLSSELSIFSSGEGNGLKKAFFSGYKNLYGLDAKNEEKILNEVKSFVAKQMLNKLW